MRWVLPLMVVGVLMLLFLGSRNAPGQAVPAAKIEARILYAGDVGTARQKEFVEFLRTYFTQVDTTDIAILQARDAEKCDVLLLDAEARKTGTSALDVPRLVLPQDFSKPTVTIGVMGGLFAGSHGLKTGYL